MVRRHAKKMSPSVARALGLVAVGVVAWIAPIDVAQAISRCGPGGKVNAAGTCDCAPCLMSVGPSGAAHCVPDPKAPPSKCAVVTPTCGNKPGQKPCPTFKQGILPLDAAVSISVKGGSFTAGSNAYNDYDAGPEHKVTVGDFKIDKYEVPVAEFEKCVKAKSCDAPPADLEAIVANGQRCNYPGRKAHPMNCVTWNEASQFCTWKGKRLPTEAEWEYAAKGGAKNNVFPWGAADATCKQANFTQGVASAGCGDGTSSIGAHPLGASAFGVQDMSGNVEEWVFDYFGLFSGMNAAAPNPYNADSSSDTRHAIKGGSWDLSTVADMHTVRREGGDAFMRQNWLGFRCASGPIPVAAPEMFKKVEKTPPPPPIAPPPPAPNVPGPSDLGAMVKIPGGSFTMGLDGDQDAAPAHMVTLGSYSMDKYEVTVGQYKKCVDAKKCAEPLLLMSQTCNWSVPGRENHPVNCVEWSDAKSYCGFAGKRLPTEAEWEYATKGNTSRKYPWGDNAPDCSTAAFFPRDKQQCASSTQVVGTHPNGVSFYGLLDMGGNVEEWVFDFWAPYTGGPANNPNGPATGDVHIIRGGNWKGPEDYMRTIGRFGPKLAMDWIGFRCAKS